MKLWQKIFISSLVLIITAVNVISVTLLEKSHRMLINREQTHAVNEHEFFAAAFSNAAVYEKTAYDKIALDLADIEAIAEKVVAEGSAQNTAVYSSSHQLIAQKELDRLIPLIDSSNFTLDTDPAGDNYSVSVFNTGESYEMAVCSAVKIENITCYVVTAVDISDIYYMKNEQTGFIRRISIISAGAISLILLITVLTLLRPLNRLNVYTKAIAGGNYKIRISEKGSQEFRELAQNMNIMADSIQNNAARLEKIADDRQSFIGALSHEMKTPLTSILGFADILRIKKTVSDSERTEYAGIIVEETSRLRSLSGKLMELVAMGGTEIEKKPVSLPELISETETALVPLLNKNSVTLDCQCEEIILNADSELFKSLLYNIIENAVKASPKGGKVELKAEMQKNSTIIRITDHGIGMSPETVQKAFEPFFMADKSRSRKAGGAGLGLALCAKIAKLHSASLDIESQLNEGTSVIITIDGGERA